MISAFATSTRLVQRLRARANRIATSHTAALRRRRRSPPEDWHSATDLWPDFTADTLRS